KAVATLAREARKEGEVDPSDATATIKFLIKNLDDQLTKQVNLIIHHDDFQKLEGSWRGLQHMVSNTETDEQLKIKVLNISKKEIGKVLKKFKGTAWEQSPLFKKLYEEEFGTPGGEPYGCIVGDYEFDHSGPDVQVLQGLSQIAAAAHTPFISAASPKLMNMDSWQELSNPSDINKLFTSPEYAPWRSLRESEDARYLGLTLPRFLSRLPYGADTNPVDDFDFEEEVENDQANFTWANAAYAMGANITRSFKLYGWCSQIRGVESGGSVEGLPCHTFPTDDGGVDMTCPTEIAITDRREAEMAKAGLMPLSFFKNTDYAVFIGAQSLQKPAEYDDPDATANANLSARLPYLFSTCRFAHYLKCIVRDKVGSFAERADMETWLNNWIRNYVEPDPSNASDEAKARRPLAAAEVVVAEVEGNPGYYSSVFYLRPHYQLEGLSASLRLVSKLPTEK
ncbi:MAG: type VI secretion system contractile sheath large subunit, partial [Candidatus Hydrogenedentes bacterium]|nr:type VI secretion system contractile sheath large subunit [Candidatus Hydrogenedentota bacterium]